MIAPARKIKLMADYFCYQLWHNGGVAVGDIDPASLPISEGLQRDCDAWARAFDAALDDIENFVTALHADQTDRNAWRNNLQATFDVEGFAEYFAVNQLIANWDTYGGLAHNFYLYGDPDQGGQLKFVGWDHDLSFDGTGPSDFTLESFDGTWPLLQAVARDPVFMRHYIDTVNEVLAAEFERGVLLERVDAYEALIAPAVAREAPGQNGIASTLVSLRRHIGEQQQRALDSIEAVGVR